MVTEAVYEGNGIYNTPYRASGVIHVIQRAVKNQFFLSNALHNADAKKVPA